MKRRTDEEIQAFLDQGRRAADARGWEREELIDLHAYELIDEALTEELEFSLPSDFADVMADRLMPRVVTPVERFMFGVVLAGFAMVGVILSIGSVALVFRGAMRVIEVVAQHGRADVVLAVAALLAGIAFLDWLLPKVRQHAGRIPLSG